MLKILFSFLILILFSESALTEDFTETQNTTNGQTIQTVKATQFKFL